MDKNNHNSQRTEPATVSETNPTTTSTPATEAPKPIYSNGGPPPTGPAQASAEIPATSPPPPVIGTSATPVAIPKPNQPLADFVPAFKAHLIANGGRSMATIINILGRLKTLPGLWPAFTTVALENLRKGDIMDLQDCLNNAKIPLTGKTYSDDTKNVTNSAVRQLLGYLTHKLEYLTDETFARLAGQLKWVSTGSRAIPVPTDDQIQLMRQYLEMRNAGRARDFAQIPLMFEVYLAFGPRRGSVSQLKVGNVDLANSRLHLTLNKRKKTVNVPTVLRLWIPAHLKTKLANYIQRFGLQPHDRLFTVFDISASLKSAALAAGLPNWYHHAFRKLVATRMVEMGIPIPIIAELLGHKDCGETILKNYWKYSQRALDDASIKYHSSWEGEHAQTPTEVAQLKARLAQLVERIAKCPPEVLQPLTEALLRVDGHLVAGNYSQALAELPPMAPATLPTMANASMPSRPDFVPESERMVIARNVLYLQLRHGYGTFELECKLQLYANAVSNLRRGKGINRATLKSLAKEFGVEVEYFYDPAYPQVDWKRVVANLQYLADKLGAASLPWPSVMAKVLHGSELPCGKILRLLTEMLPCLTIEMLMDTDITTNSVVAQAVANLAQTQIDARNNLADHIQIYYWAANVNGMELARRTGLKSNQIHAYAAARQLPPAENLARIAQVLGRPVTDLQRPATMPTAADIGRRVSGWLAGMKLTPLTAAGKMSTSAREFALVAAGERLPSASQLRRMSAFFSHPIETILGIKLPIVPPAPLPPPCRPGATEDPDDGTDALPVAA